MEQIKAKVAKRVIPNWRDAHKWWSVRFGVLAVALEGVLTAAPEVAQEVWLGLPEELKAELPENFVKWIAWGLIAASMIARITKQKPKVVEDQDHG